MPLDALCLCGVRAELAGQIQGMKIEKVQQPERDVIILSLRSIGAKTLRLLISVGSDDSRVHLTTYKFDNPKAPPMFCMLLRKHITGAKIIEIKQPPAERVLSFQLETSDTMGEKSEKNLHVELIGRQANIILCENDGIIIDCLRRIGGELDEKRSVLPGLIYRAPPAQPGKLDPLCVTDKELCDLLKPTSSASIDKWLISTFTAVSPLICREIAWRAYGETDYRIDMISDDGIALRREFLSLMEQVKSGAFEPWLLSSDDNIAHDFSFTRIMQYENMYKATRESSFSFMLDSFYTHSSKMKRISQRSMSTLKTMNTARDRLIRKLTAQKSELEDTSKRDYLRESGDIITSNLHLIKKGQHTLVADDFYSPNNAQREIKLDPLKSPQQNAAKYYKAYTKSKNASKYVNEQIQKGEMELEYIESVIEQIRRIGNESELSDIRSELEHTGYIKKQKHQKAKAKQIESSPMRFTSSSGMRLSVGKNNMQNDKLTLKSSSKSDIWLHVQKIHGAHVVISCAGMSPDEHTLYEAASIAAYYSSARNGSKVPVDYTLVKNVKKPSGGRPGMVIYNDFKTIIATPDEALVKRLRDES